MELILDTETTRTILGHKKDGSPSPYLPTNRLVSVQTGGLDTAPSFFTFYHQEGTDKERKANFALVQEELNKATLLIGHNLKFDLAWLRECGFKYDGDIWDTQIFEHIVAKGQAHRIMPSLNNSAERRGLEISKLDILSEYWKEGVNTDGIPLEELKDYALRDIDVTRELYLIQKELLAAEEEVQYMWPAIRMRNKFLSSLVDMERDGCPIDEEALEELEDEYRKELNDLTFGLKNLMQEYAGDKPYNLASPEQLSQVVYGYKFKSPAAKVRWKEKFGLGTEDKGGVKKKKYPKRLRPAEIRELIEECMEELDKTEAEQCEDCRGLGHFYKIKKDGTNYKKPTTCKNCEGTGVYYRPVGQRGGFCVLNPGSYYATTNGFAVNKDAIEVLLERTKGLKRITRKQQATIDFLTALERIGSVENYLSNFIIGIKNNTIHGLLHTTFNQCMTATGRLSSSNPNFQNLPRAKTFPVRKVIVSRWKNGKIISADVAQFEFRVAAFLSQCEKAIDFIKAKKDIHRVSADYYGIDRQSAKAETFGPLYGKKNDYAEHFYKVFPGIKAWHVNLLQEAIDTKEVRSLSGMIYAFPGAERVNADKVKFETQICNYPVQGFATGDVTPLIIMYMHKRIKELGLQSKVILTVHDDITADCHPDEVDQMQEVFIESFKKIPELVEEEFGVTLNVPVDFDVAIGYNWMDKEQVYP